MKKLLRLFVFVFFPLWSYGQFHEPIEVRSYERNTPIKEIEILDLNGDNLVEIVALSNDFLIVYQNNGAYDLSPDTIYSFDGGKSVDLLKVELATVGAISFLITTDYGQPLLFSSENGGLTLEGEISLETDVSGRKLEKGLINGDEYQDLAFYSEEGVAIFLNDGTDSFALLNTVSNPVLELAIGDLNGDGLDDIITATEIQLKYFENSDGGFMLPILLFNEDYYYTEDGTSTNTERKYLGDPQIDLYDIDGDGDLDLSYKSLDQGTYIDYYNSYTREDKQVLVWVVRNLDPSNFPLGASATQSALFNRTFFNEEELTYYQNRIPENAAFTLAQLIENATPEYVVSINERLYIGNIDNYQEYFTGVLHGDPHVVDLDNSGSPEVLIVNQNGMFGFFKDITNWTGGTDAIEEFVPLTAPNYSLSDFAAHTDEGGLEKQYLLETSELSHSLLSIDYSNLPDIEMEELLNWNRENENLSGLSFGDLNGDGFDDLIFIGENNFDPLTEDFSLYTCIANENSFSQPFLLIDTIIRTNSIVKPQIQVYDLNGDGLDDLVLKSCINNNSDDYQNCQVFSLLNVGGLNFQINGFTDSFKNYWGFEIGDFNADDEADILVNSTYPVKIALYSNTMEELEEIAEDIFFTSAFNADINQDGIDDLLIINRSSSENLRRAGSFIASAAGEYGDVQFYPEVNDDLLIFANVRSSEIPEIIDEDQIFQFGEDETLQAFTWNEGQYEMQRLSSGFFTDPDLEDVVSLVNTADSQQLLFSKNIFTLNTEIVASVFDDLNGNGLRDPDEQGLSFIPISFVHDQEDQQGLAFTNSAGEVSFDVLAIGSVTLEVVFDPEDWALTTNNSPITFDATQSTSIEFGLQSLSGFGFQEMANSKESAINTPTASDQKDNGSLQFLENNGITTNEYVFIDNEYAYQWIYENSTGDIVNDLSIVNEIPAELDWSTFQPQATSHDGNIVVTSLLGSAELEVTYANLLLPDASENPEESILSFTYSLTAHSDELHEQLVSSQVVATVEGDEELSSNITENKVYTCQGFEEILSFDIYETCSPGAIGYRLVENQPEILEFTISKEGIDIPFESQILYAELADTSIYIFEALSGDVTTDLSALNEFGCSLLLEEIFLIDTIPSLEMLSDVNFLACFEAQTEVFVDSDFPLSNVTWYLQDSPDSNFNLAGTGDTIVLDLNVSESIANAVGYVNYEACTDTVSQEIQFTAINLNNGFIDLIEPPGGGIHVLNAPNDSVQWYLEGVEIDGANSVEITDPQQGGNYTCEVFLNGCFYFTPPYFWSALFIGNFTEVEFKVYPNPSSDWVKVEFDSKLNDQDYFVVITDNLGRQVLKETLKSDGYNISRLSSGVYSVSLINKGSRLGHALFVVH